jgi:glycosyltransferase involved in cell wall biosynthesis
MKKISVIVPCRNEVRHIEETVLSILNSDYSNIEVLVVDGMSIDGTRDLLEKMCQDHPKLKVVDNPEQLTPYAFNHGINNSDGEYVQIMGARNILASNYLSLLAKVLEEKPEVAITGGNYGHRYNTNLGKYIAKAMTSKFGVGASNFRTMKKSAYVDTVGIPLIRRSLFDEIGFFDESLTRNQDDDFSYRAIKAGHQIYYLVNAKTEYLVRANFLKLFKQYSQYGYFKVFVNLKHKHVTTLRQLVPVAFLSFLILGLLITLISPSFSSSYFSIIFLYYVLGFYFAYQESENINELFLIQWSFFVLHIGYGFGYLKGLIDFVLLNKVPEKKMQSQTT